MVMVKPGLKAMQAAMPQAPTPGIVAVTSDIVAATGVVAGPAQRSLLLKQFYPSQRPLQRLQLAVRYRTSSCSSSSSSGSVGKVGKQQQQQRALAGTFAGSLLSRTSLP